MNFVHNVYAAATPLGPILGDGPFGDFATKATGESALIAVTNIVSNVIGVMTVAAAIYFLFNFVIGGINWISAGGDKNKINEARDRITYAFLGLLVTVAGMSILAVMGIFLGYDITIKDPAALIGKFKFN